MSDTPPDQKEAGDAPEAPRNQWVGWLVWAVLVPVLYVLSTGPVYRLIGLGHIAPEWAAIYDPLGYLGEDFVRLVFDYAGWWGP